ncbi:N-6 DNA methylase [Komagataeibacter nataicola]|nr:N-6 DNA methylase [Komagataeibacter nataicola]GBR23593.1 type I restriction-modification system M subunit [Komagataeibacter nataicola NRIC 0616]
MTNGKHEFTFDKLQKVVEKFTDRIRHAGRGNSQDFMPITVGTLMLKRIIDERTHYKRFLIQQLSKEGVTLDAFVEKNNTGKFKVDETALWSFRLDWSDVAQFPGNVEHASEGITYTDMDCIRKHGVGVDNHAYVPVDENGALITMKTGLVKFLANSFRNELFRQLFDVFNFTSLVGQRVSDTDRIVMDDACFDGILSELDPFDFSVHQEDRDIFADVYMELIGNYTGGGGKQSGEFFTPPSIVQNAVRFIRFDRELDNVKIGDPTAGVCTFAIEGVNAFSGGNQSLKDKVEVVVGEKSIRSGVLGATNIYLNGIEKSHVYIGDSITEYPEKLGQFSGKLDYIFANPPYGLKDYGIDHINKKDAVWKYGVPKKGDCEYAFLQVVMDLMNDRGQAVLVMPMNTLFKSSTKAIRKAILETGCVAGIVSLPPKLFQNTDIPVCLWILDKDRPDMSVDGGTPSVMMIDSSRDFKRDGKRNIWTPGSSMNVDAFQIYHEQKNINGYSCMVSYEQIKQSGYRLDTGAYIFNEEEELIDIKKVRNNMRQLTKALFADLYGNKALFNL